jgi:competence protein ComFB
MTDLSNHMEKLVFSKLDEILKTRPDVCSCEHCRLDIAAIALNSLAPRYIVTDRGQLYAKLDMLETQFGVDILMAIARGIDVVSKHPRHDAKA